MDTKSKNSKRRLAAFFLVLAIICYGAVGVITGYIPANGYLNDMTGPRSMLTTSVRDHNAYRQRVRDIELLLSSQDFSSPTNAQRFIDSVDFYLELTFRNGSNLDTFVIENNITPEDITLYKAAVTLNSGNTGWQFIYPTNVKCNSNMPLISITYGMAQSEYSEISSMIDIQRWNMWVMFVADVVLIIAGVVFSLLYIERTSAAFRDAEALPKRFSIFYEISLAAAGLAVVAAGMLMLGSDSLYLLPIAEYSEIGKGVYMAICGAATSAAGLSIVYIFTSASVRCARKQGLNGSFLYRLLGVVFKAIKWLVGYAKRFFRFLGELLTGRLFKGTAAKRLLWLDLLFIILSLLNVLWFILFLESFFVVFIIACEIIITALFLYGRYMILRDGAVLENNIKKVYETPSAELSALPEKSVYYNSNESLRMLSAQYAKSLDETVKAERMKIDLVTNVSHDLKTPLTSIISYVELLSKEELTAAASDYVKILKAKSERLKNIVSDVFELAKTTSGEIEIQHEELDLTKLCWQTLGEMEDKIAKSGFDVKPALCDPPVTILSDGKRVYRIIQNLLDNALKYSLAGTRIYFLLEKNDDSAAITIKNISAYEMDFTAEDIMERFTRGDKSRTTEGSGLGLSIAQGFAMACGGKLEIQIDGDMFKAIVTFPIYKKTATHIVEPITVPEDIADE